MVFLAAGVLFTVLLFLIFRYFAVFKVDTFVAVVINYAVCVVTGLIFSGNLDAFKTTTFLQSWVPYASILGIIFIITFTLMAITAQKISVTASSVANKISLVIPVLFSLFIFKSDARSYDFFNYLGMSLTVFAVVLTSVKKGEKYPKGPTALLLPMAVFILGGVIDTLINYVNLNHLTESSQKLFPIFIFLSATIAGAAVILFRLLRTKRLTFHRRTLIGGLALGIVNYFSVYYMLKALSFYNNEGAFFYPVFNILIIVCSAFASVLLFKEKFSRINRIGIAVAVLSLILIAYKEITAFIF